MATSESAPNADAVLSRYRPLRIWIPVLLLPLMVLARFIPGLIPNPPAMIWMVSAFGPFLIGLLVLLWWLLASRARWFERILGVAGLIAILALELVLAHSSMREVLFIVMTIPMTVAAFSIGLILLSKRLSMRRTWVGLLLATLAASVSTLFTSDGVWGDFSFGMDWRWKQTSEDRLMTQLEATAGNAAVAVDLASFKKSEWPGFRGPNSDGVQHGRVFSDDWTANPPKEKWRMNVGPAWSSFAVAGDYLVTQEQRGENEAVVCYDARIGEQVWAHAVPSRFFEALGGLGPRATPSIAGEAIYAMGAEGWLVKLQAANGEEVWKVDLRKEADRAPPMWGFSSSPFVHDDLVIVHAGGKDDKGVLAFHTSDGSLAWSAPAGENSYGSVQSMTLAGKEYLALLSDVGAHFWDPKTGAVALDYKWPHMGYRALQPQLIDGDKVLIPTGIGTGTRLIQIVEQEDGLQVTDLWTSLDMKPDFNDLLVHKGYLYGFDNSIFACIDLKDGKRKWKGGRYEKGQAVLLADSDLIVVISERGQLVLLRTNPNKLKELAKIPAMDGKTWNHPVVVGDKLYLRNAEEAVCYELATVSASTVTTDTGDTSASTN